MWVSLVESILKDFDKKQDDAFGIFDGNAKAILDNIPKGDEFGFGQPPYIVEDGMHALLLVSADGGCLRLHPFDELSEDSVNEDYLSIYSLPTADGGILQLIPANPDYKFQIYQRAQILEDFRIVDTLLTENCLQSSTELSSQPVKIRFAQFLIAANMAFRKNDSKNSTSFEEFLRSTEGTKLLNILAHAAIEQVNQENQ